MILEGKFVYDLGRNELELIWSQIRPLIVEFFIQLVVFFKKERSGQIAGPTSEITSKYMYFNFKINCNGLFSEGAVALFAY